VFFAERWEFKQTGADASYPDISPSPSLRFSAGAVGKIVRSALSTSGTRCDGGPDRRIALSIAATMVAVHRWYMLVVYDSPPPPSPLNPPTTKTRFFHPSTPPFCFKHSHAALVVISWDRHDHRRDGGVIANAAAAIKRIPRVPTLSQPRDMIWRIGRASVRRPMFHLFTPVFQSTPLHRRGSIIVRLASRAKQSGRGRTRRGPARDYVPHVLVGTLAIRSVLPPFSGFSARTRSSARFRKGPRAMYGLALFTAFLPGFKCCGSSSSFSLGKTEKRSRAGWDGRSVGG